MVYGRSDAHSTWRRGGAFRASKLAAVKEAAAKMPKSRKKKRPPKRVLALPDLEQSKTAVVNSLTSKSGQRSYDHAITDFVEWYCSEPRAYSNPRMILK
jgi:hypothetical protein